MELHEYLATDAVGLAQLVTAGDVKPEELRRLAAERHAATHAQINAVAAIAREVADLGDIIEETPWMGRRPTLVDSLPMIGKAPRHENLWFNFGHHHTGLTMSAGSARIIAALIHGETSPVDATPFSPERFRL